jgi:glycosyltransferase involved in cell wall biosynthesis
MRKTIVVVPCFNEERRLAVYRFRAFLAQNANSSLLLVDDGSNDGTLQLLRGIAEDDPSQAVVLELPHNMGKAEAIRRGVLEAFRWQPDFVGFWDADLATPLELVGAFCEVLARRPEIQLVIGCRLRLQGHRIRRGPLRHALGRVFAMAASQVLGLPICDTQCGAKMLRATPAVQAAFQRPFLSRWIFDVEMMARIFETVAGQSGAIDDIVYELPLEQWSAVPNSKLKSNDFVRAFWELLQIYAQYARRRRPRPVAAGPQILPFPEVQSSGTSQQETPAALPPQSCKGLSTARGRK